MRKMKKVYLFTILSILLTSALTAHGKGDIEDISVVNMNSWQEQFDLESRKPGKYNIMITARDLGGNVHIEGPHNIYLDPKSDLPICGITNPYPSMRVVGNLNIVGTCVDDDGVSRVDLILDEGTDHEKQVTAEGKEFWSYYLDTNDLEEGDHTIKVIGYDINDEPKVSKPYVLTWQLDRKQPVTEVQDKTMGILVSGNVKFDGVVTDGNGIKELYYSTDNGENFIPLKFGGNKNKVLCDFTVSVDTKKFPDGPAVLWFKAIDKAGSVGMYSFLYFIDNTKPDVGIVYPEEGQVMDGKFTVAGYAKDTIGVTELSWSFGNQSGDFELIPGNPYWAVNVDTITSKDKSTKFTIHAKDRAGNVVDVSRNIALNQENDKPVVTVSEPVNGQDFGESDPLFVRGIATDPDGVKAVRILFDGNEPIVQETKGVFYYELCKPGELAAGNHKVTVTAIDVNDVVGNPVVINIASRGNAPQFGEASIGSGKESEEFKNGMEIHPESGKTFSLGITSGIGMVKVSSSLTWGDSGLSETSVDLKNVTSYTYTLPILPESAKGIMNLTITAEDIIGRTSTYRAIYYVRNTTVVKAEEPAIVFDDSTVAEDGSIISDPNFPVTGYLIGANAASVELVPATKFARAELEGNLIRLIASDSPDVAGSSGPVVVRIKTDKGKTIESRPLNFRSDTQIPEITINDYSENTALNGLEGPVTISGKVTCDITGVGALKYRVMSATVDIQKGIIGTVTAPVANDDFKDVSFAKDGSFSFEFNAEDYGYGLHLIELIAESAGGNKIAKGIAVKNIPDVEEQNGKMPVPKAPAAYWADGFDVYALAVYQGEMTNDYQSFPRSEMIEGNNPLGFASSTMENKLIAAKYTAVKNPTLSAHIVQINDADYMSGMPVVLGYNSKDVATIRLYIDTGAAVSSVNYEISGEEIAGGAVSQKGAAKLIKPDPTVNPMRWTAEIPVTNLPSRVNKVSATIKAGTLEQTVTGFFTVVRPEDESLINDKEGIYPIPAADTVFDEVDNNYVLSYGSKFYYYVNYNAPFKVELVSQTQGLAVEADGQLVTLYAEKDGNYKNVILRITDRFGDVHNSTPLSFIANTSAPEVNFVTPELFQWVGNTFKLSGTAAHPLGIRAVEYSLDNGETWEAFDLGKNNNRVGVTFSKDVNLQEVPDGLIRINMRARDTSGHESYIYTAAYKDVTPPVVRVVEPQEIDVVNGDNLIVFEVTDNALLAKAEYVAPPEKGRSQTRLPLELNPLIYTHIGTPEAPISDAMSFIFTDDAGNATPIESWQFSIDNESDLPRAEIHVPEEMQVITRDFVISGVVYDDDGESSIFYKIDNGEYKQVSTKEVYKSVDPYAEYKLNTSFSIDVPLSTMTDNEHTVTVYAVDVNGVKGPEVARTYRISLEEPKGAVEKPTIDTSVRNLVTISGWASDKNGIANIKVSLDNGNSYNEAVGTENWSYTVDTRAIPGGTQVVFLKVTDNYGIQGLYSSLINIDNDAPVLSLELPLDDSTTTGQLFFSGYTYDNVEVTDLYLTIRNLEKGSSPDIRKMKIDRIIGETVDLRNLSNGFYNVELTGKDKAGNTTNVSRNIHLEKNIDPATVDILYPLEGEHKNGMFTIYGQAASENEITLLNLWIDNKLIGETTLTSCGFFKFDLGPENIEEGVHTYRVDTVLSTGQVVKSREQTITYSPVGPWVKIDNFTYGDFAINRPYIKGQAGYSISEDELLFSRTKEATKEQKDATAAKKVAKIEMSFDNGKTFTELSTNEKWMYRIENQDIAEGYHFFLIRATMKNGETAITRTIIQVDNTAPSIRLIAPIKGGRYNQVLNASGLSNDDVELEDVTVTLRKGDKAAYEIPSFIQGLYVDFRFWGSSLFAVGAGLTFFDDIVKVQASYGQFTQAQRDAISNIFKVKLTDGRYGGNIFSLKILANVASLPFSFFLGHDWDWLYAQFAVGAEFAMFTKTGSGKSQILSSLLAQMEFPKVKLQNVKMFSTFSLYTEGSLWFIPTDVSGTDIKSLVPQIAIGFRTNIF